MLDAIAEFNPFDDLGEAALAVELAPFLLGGQHQLVGHGQRGLAAEAAFGFGGSVADGGEGAFDGVRCPDVLPVFGREVVEGEQIGSVFGQAFDCPVVFHSVSLDEEIEGGVGLSFGLGHPDVFQMRLGLGLDRLGHGVQNICGLVDPAPLDPGLAVNLVQGGPEPHGTITNGKLRRSFQAPAFQIEEQLAPTLGALAKAVDQAQHILVAPFVCYRQWFASKPREAHR